MQKVKNRKKLENDREKKLLIAPFGPPPLFSYNSVFAIPLAITPMGFESVAAQFPENCYAYAKQKTKATQKTH
jgi:hypothetical protein